MNQVSLRDVTQPLQCFKHIQESNWSQVASLTVDVESMLSFIHEMLEVRFLVPCVPAILCLVGGCLGRLVPCTKIRDMKELRLDITRATTLYSTASAI